MLPEVTAADYTVKMASAQLPKTIDMQSCLNNSTYENELGDTLTKLSDDNTCVVRAKLFFFKFFQEKNLLA